MCIIQSIEDADNFDVEGHVEDLVAFFCTLGLSPCQMIEVLEEMVCDALGANSTRH